MDSVGFPPMVSLMSPLLATDPSRVVTRTMGHRCILQRLCTRVPSIPARRARSSMVSKLFYIPDILLTFITVGAYIPYDNDEKNVKVCGSQPIFMLPFQTFCTGIPGLVLQLGMHHPRHPASIVIPIVQHINSQCIFVLMQVETSYHI